MRYAICNETFEGWEHLRESAATAAELGYTGLEVAPFTLAPRITDVPLGPAPTAACGKQRPRRPISIIGLHWLRSPRRMACTSPRPIRRFVKHGPRLSGRAWRKHVGTLGSELMVFGSPAQYGGSRRAATRAQRRSITRSTTFQQQMRLTGLPMQAFACAWNRLLPPRPTSSRPRRRRARFWNASTIRASCLHLDV